jgi:KamA family protein
MQYKPYSLQNFKTIPQVKNLSKEQIQAIEIVGSTLPFRTNNYIVEQLIDWSNIPNDPMFIATFPQKDMLKPDDYRKVKSLYESGADSKVIKHATDEIRLRLNPHPAGQLKYNIPVFKDKKLYGVQYKYRETILFFPNQGQTCHAFCTFCFRWPQFTDIKELKISSSEIDSLINYIKAHPEITDVLFTGGDSLVMKTEILARLIEPLLTDNLPYLQTIRIGTRALSYWPYRFVTDKDADELLSLFQKVRQYGKQLTLMVQFNHPIELETDIVKEAICKIQKAGVVIRTQSPLLRHINNSPQIWAEMWRRQVSLNCIPYYMFIARNTGPHQYFSLPLIEAWQIFKQAYQSVSGLCRTVRGPVMSCLPGKVQIIGVIEVRGDKVIVLNMIQGRNPEWVGRPFLAEFSDDARWYTDLKPAFGEKGFFFQDELESLLESGETEDDYE